MKIALIGYGKMGKTLEQIALQRGHEVVLTLDLHNFDQFDRLPEADVAIEFTRPDSAPDNLRRAFSLGVPIVCGTTGWLHQLPDIINVCKAQNGALLHATNFSIGVNIFFEINKRLAALMNPHSNYAVTTEEIHHTQKLDAPSGTAITLAEGILSHLDRKNSWVCDAQNIKNTEGVSNPKGDYVADNQLLIVSKRIDPAPGTHIVTYHSPIDTIEIKHTAHSREGFATGAVVAAEWLKGKTGVFSMPDVLGL